MLRTLTPDYQHYLQRFDRKFMILVIASIMLISGLAIGVLAAVAF